MEKKIVKKIKEYKTIIIHGHQNPDGDCFGSQFGLKDLILENFRDKEVYVVGQNCLYASFLGSVDEIDDSKFEGALSIVVDCGPAKRVSDQRFNLSKEVIKIDHHIDSELYGDINWIDEEAPACAQMITSIVIQNKLSLSPVGANALYTGILTDTGGFKFRGVSSQTFYYCALLLEFGVSPEYIDELMNKRTIEELKFKEYIYSNFKTSKRVIYLTITKDIYEDVFKIPYEVAASAVSNFSNITGYPVWLVIIEQPTTIRIRFRSNLDGIDKFAKNYGGGGHSKAAGGTLESFNDLDKLLTELDNWVDEQNNNRDTEESNQNL
jgi:phosphoesterase RecJ-like protein